MNKQSRRGSKTTWKAPVHGRRALSGQPQNQGMVVAEFVRIVNQAMPPAPPNPAAAKAMAAYAQNPPRGARGLGSIPGTLRPRRWNWCWPLPGGRATPSMHDGGRMIAQELEVSLHMAFVEARQQRHEFITVEHLLLALLDNPSAAEVLRACAANVDDLRKSLTSSSKRTPPPWAAPTRWTPSPRLVSSASSSAPSCMCSPPAMARRK